MYCDSISVRDSVYTTQMNMIFKVTQKPCVGIYLHIQLVSAQDFCGSFFPPLGRELDSGVLDFSVVI